MLLALAALALAARGAAEDGVVVFQQGRVLTSASDHSSFTYDDVFETSISTQYIDNWNNYNGGYDSFLHN
jgi:hypothetical protein